MAKKDKKGKGPGRGWHNHPDLHRDAAWKGWAKRNGLDVSELKSKRNKKIGKKRTGKRKSSMSSIPIPASQLPKGKLRFEDIGYTKKYYVVEGRTFYSGDTFSFQSAWSNKANAVKEKNRTMNLTPIDLRQGLRTRIRHRELTQKDVQILEWEKLEESDKKKDGKKKLGRVIVKHWGENNRRYELNMKTLPENPTDYFNEVIIGGDAGWEWSGPGTAERIHAGTKEWVQIND